MKDTIECRDFLKTGEREDALVAYFLSILLGFSEEGILGFAINNYLPTDTVRNYAYNNHTQRLLVCTINPTYN